MARYTEKQLSADVDRFNQRLLAAGVMWQFFHNPRNGYQAVDYFECDATGKQSGDGMHNVGCGTPREVLGFCESKYYELVNRAERERREERLKAFADCPQDKAEAVAHLVLNLLQVPHPQNRIDTARGTKTVVGLGRCIVDIVGGQLL